METDIAIPNPLKFVNYTFDLNLQPSLIISGTSENDVGVYDLELQLSCADVNTPEKTLIGHESIRITILPKIELQLNQTEVEGYNSLWLNQNYEGRFKAKISYVTNTGKMVIGFSETILKELLDPRLITGDDLLLKLEPSVSNL